MLHIHVLRVLPVVVAAISLSCGGAAEEIPRQSCPAAGCDCVGERCLLDCADPDTCDLSCTDGADCELECGAADSCTVDCIELGDCYVDCGTSTTCTVHCALGSQCECDGDACHMTCDEEQLTCDGGPCECG